MDCEDATCNIACTEICGGGADEDDDGLTDCEDDDCLGRPPCVQTTAWVTSGQSLHGWGKNQDWWWALAYEGVCQSSQTFKMTLWTGFQSVSAAGMVRVTESDGAIATCSWEVDEARWSWRGATFRGPAEVQASWFDRVSRAGFRVSEGCPLTTSGFLPRRLGGDGTMVGWSGDGGAPHGGRFYDEIYQDFGDIGFWEAYCSQDGWNPTLSSSVSFSGLNRPLVGGEPYTR